MGSLYFFFFFLFFLFFLSIELILAADTITPTRFIRDGETLVSSRESFELGFFSPGNSTKRYLGIWYKKIPETVVWVANRNNPIIDRQGVLTIINYGNLVLLNKTKSIMWSSNTSRTVENPVAQLLDSGNLVLMDNFSTGSGSYLWQSFDYPSDTLLPGMKLGWDLKTGVERYLTSWKSADDPSYGDFTFRLDIHVLPQVFIYNGSTKVSRSGPWNGVFFGGVPESPNFNFELTFVHDKNEIYYSYESFNNPVIMLTKVTHSGFFQRLIWKERGSIWNVVASAPKDLCEYYGKCSANGVCSIDKAPICECLQGFIPESQQNQTLPTRCVRSSPFDCRSGDRFIKLTGLKLPDLVETSLNDTMSLQECESKCLKNCSCKAYANSIVSGGGRGCLMWSGDLIDIRKHVAEGSGQDLYIRVRASEQVSDLNENRRQKIIVAVLVISGIVILFSLLFCIWKKTTKKARLTTVQENKEDVDVHLFDLSTIATATNNFSRENLIGAGGFGPVYKGTLSTGEEVAVKRLSNNSGQGAEEFRNEVNLIAKLQHRNLVGLLGSCIQGEERLLIYEYMPNKSLDYFVFDQKKAGLLTWQRRFDIVMGIARGLLGDDKEAKTNRVIGTYGYMSPEYATDGTFSVKSDVFSFGVFILEIISGKKNRGFSHPAHHHNLLGHAWLLWNEMRALELMDSSDTITPKETITHPKTIISSGGRFELGFFSLKNDTSYYLGIWYREVSPQTVVWVANREYPIISSSASLSIGSDGNIVIFDSKMNYSVTNTASSCNTYATLVDSGVFSLVLDFDDLIIKNGSKIYWRGGDRGLFNLSFSTDYYGSSYVTLVDELKYRRVVLDVSGQLKLQSLTEGVQGWYTLEASTCGISGCGSFGICNKNAQMPCVCLPGFNSSESNDSSAQEPHETWVVGARRRVRKTVLGCSSNSSSRQDEDGFLTIENADFPINPLKLDVKSSMECESASLSNCSWIAYAFNERNGLCFVWDNDLLDLKKLIQGDSNGRNFFLKLSATELNSHESDPSNGTLADPAYQKNTGNKKQLLIIVILTVSLTVVTTLSFVMLCVRGKLRRKGPH
ncbi:hypothetical protein LWI28_019410 [Acer negundo]|uniref:non-specific serine/threonine protein kinase n=1 Tax=Acer negundo TaxID=4023 RepID=A0AAD5J5Q7_ACENE|nr:hypothetical protein LWI28_019410 [Acer negundo]